jgi:alkylated DNA repair dioxygenase AlkB
MDLANERDVAGDGYVGVDEINVLRQVARTLDPDLIVTASFGAHDLTRSQVRAALKTADLDFLAVHRPRNRRSPQQTEAQTLVLRDLVNSINWEAPIHYQEPFRRDFGPWQPTAADFLTDLQGARDGGAAGWCLHNGAASSAGDGRPRRSFDLREQSLIDQLDAEELKVLQAMHP